MRKGTPMTNDECGKKAREAGGRTVFSLGGNNDFTLGGESQSNPADC
jgi:hypothetical protein